MIAANIKSIRAKILDAHKRSSTSNRFTELLAVSKTRPVGAIREAMASGQTQFAENRVQEMVAKAEEIASGVDWHFIGHLQKNKIRKILPVCNTIHSVDALGLAEQINRIAGEIGLFPKVYLEVNIAQDGAKFGFSAESVRRDLDALLSLDRIEILGLMTIPSFSPDPEASRPHFAALRELGESLAREAGVPMDGLSMGMSHDYEIAVEEGATAVRVGTEIFGPRGQDA